MKRSDKWHLAVHYAAAVVGGFLGGYSVFNHADILCNAQTGNLIRLAHNVVEGDFSFVWLMALALVIYCGGTVFYALVHRKVRCSMKIVCMICIAAAIALTGLICFVKSDFIAVYPLIFVAPIQWNAFKTVDCDSSSTIFCSSNVLQATMLTTNFVLTKDRNYARRATVYWMTLLSFVTGATLACIVSMHCGVSGIWFAYLPLALTAFAYLRYYAAKKSENLNQPQG